MATVPATATKAVGDKVSANWANNNVKTPIDWDFTGKPIFFAAQTVAQTGWTSGTFTPVTFPGGEPLDRDNQHAANASRVIIGGTLGWYKVTGLYAPATNSVASIIRAGIMLNGSLVPGSFSAINVTASANAATIQTGTVRVQATASTDYIELQGFMTAASGTIGTNVTGGVASSLDIEWCGS